MNLDGSSVLVTGGAGGIGAATVRHLAALGMRPVVLDVVDGPAKELADEVGGAAVTGDVTDDEVVGRALAAAVALAPLRVVVNLAGGATGGGRLLGRDGTPHDMGVFTSTMAQNAQGTFNVSRLAAQAMAGNEPDEDGQRGVIINTASIAGYEGLSGQLAYAAAKGAILGMTLPMARDLAPVGVRVCAIAPGTIGTPRMVAALPLLKEDPSAGVAFPKRMGRPEEYALLVELIARNSYLNGENIRLDGGLRFVSR